jgi:hypothetical protein
MMYLFVAVTMRRHHNFDDVATAHRWGGGGGFSLREAC